MRRGTSGGVGEALDHAVEVKAPVEAPDEAGKVALGVLAADMAVGPGERGLDVAQAGVDPAAPGGSGREASAVGDGAGVNGTQRAACLPEPVSMGKCAQPAFCTAPQQDRPSLTEIAPVWWTPRTLSREVFPDALMAQA